jgi:hypothetical protein
MREPQTTTPNKIGRVTSVDDTNARRDSTVRKAS